MACSLPAADVRAHTWLSPLDLFAPAPFPPARTQLTPVNVAPALNLAVTPLDLSLGEAVRARRVVATGSAVRAVQSPGHHRSRAMFEAALICVDTGASS